MLHRLLLLLLILLAVWKLPLYPDAGFGICQASPLFAMEISLRGMPRALLSKPLTTERHSTPEGSFSSVSTFACWLVVPRAKKRWARRFKGLKNITHITGSSDTWNT